MKKITAYILLAALCLSLCACSLVPEAEVVVVPEQSPEVSGSPETPAPPMTRTRRRLTLSSPFLTSFTPTIIPAPRAAL